MHNLPNAPYNPSTIGSESSVTDSLATLHWLRLPERVEYKVALMAYRVLHSLAPQYLDQLVPVADLPGRRRLRSASTLQLHV